MKTTWLLKVGSKASSGSSEAVLVCRQYTELSWTTKVLPTHIWKEGVLNFISVLKYATALAVFQHQHGHVCVRLFCPESVHGFDSAAFQSLWNKLAQERQPRGILPEQV